MIASPPQDDPITATEGASAVAPVIKPPTPHAPPIGRTEDDYSVPRPRPARLKRRGGPGRRVKSPVQCT